MRLIAFFSTTLLLVCICLASPTGAADRPNIVILMVDDMGWSNIGCYGGMAETPNLDRLAESGVRFNQFYNAARCCPTRASLMTGLHPHQVGIGHMTLPIRENPNATVGQAPISFPITSADRSHIPESYQGWLNTDVPTLPEMLQGSGYSTYMAGKWHLANEKQSTWPIQLGFDRFYGHLSGTSNYFKPFNLFRDNEWIQASGDNFYLTDAISTEAIGFLSDHESKKDQDPFFLYLAFNAPHFPMQCMPEDFKKYRGRFMEGWDTLRAQRLERQKKMKLVPQNTTLAPRPNVVPAWENLSDEKKKEMDAIMATYVAMIDRVDQNVGKLIEHLEQTDELENTLLFFLSDNGAEAESGPFGQFEFKNLGQYGKGGQKYGMGWATLSNTPFREYKHFTHQGGIQTPLIVHWPAGIPENQRNRIEGQYGYLPDLVETCLDVAGAKRPAKKNRKTVPSGDGTSLVGVLQGGTTPLHDEPICIEHEGKRVVRHFNWKLVAYPGKPWELYDIDTDRSESTDRSQDRMYVAKRLAAAYDEWAERVGVLPWDTAKTYSVYGGKNRSKKK
ncbi:MAG: arylsulfatase [Rubripirellula sp.]